MLNSVFEDIKVIGESEDPEWIAAKLQQMKDPNVKGEVVGDTNLEQGDKGILEFLNLVQDQPWMYATHKFGYIAKRKSGSMAQLASSALSAETFTDALRQIQAERLLVIIDSCHAAGMATSKEADLELDEEFDDFVRVAPSKGLIEELKQGKGRVVFTSSEGQQKSLWIKSNSIYTYHFLEALQGAGNQPGLS